MAIFRSLTFDGVNSLDYGIYITGEAVYNAPERAVEMVTIPGKNGALAIDQGRFENIEVTYHAGCFADNQADFAEKVMKFRNALASRYTYKKLTDEYHTDEYRFGLYKSGLEVDAVHYSTAGEFDIAFDCKPQRFLTNGETALTPSDYIDTQTATGEIVTIDSDGSLGVKALKVALEPIQSLNGYDRPWVGGAGKNKLPYPYAVESRTLSGITYNVLSDGSVSLRGTATSAVYLNFHTISAPFRLSAGTYTISGGTGSSVVIVVGNMNNEAIGTTDTRPTFTVSEDTDVFAFAQIANGTTVDTVLHPQIEIGSTATSFAPYSNICPISGRTEVVTHVSPTQSASDGHTYTTDLGQTVYGGVLDVVSGELVVTHAIRTFDGTEDWRNPDSSGICWFRDDTLKKTSNYEGTIIASTMPTARTRQQLRDDFECGISGYEVSGAGNYWYIKAPSQTTQTNTALKAWLQANNVQVVYELANPQTVQLSPQQVKLLLGTNNVWSDGGEITVTYGVHPYYNPSPFDSKPLIKVTGTGTLGIGEYILTITGTATQAIYIDCETMEIYTYEGTVPTGASSLVSINKNDFPVLKPGINNISVGSGITAVTITPRWWRI